MYSLLIQIARCPFQQNDRNLLLYVAIVLYEFIYIYIIYNIHTYYGFSIIIVFKLTVNQCQLLPTSSHSSFQKWWLQHGTWNCRASMMHVIAPSVQTSALYLGRRFLTAIHFRCTIPPHH